MKRLITEELKKWQKAKNKKPLIIIGARQVGKSYSVASFGKRYYKQLVIFNFERNPELQEIFKVNLEAIRIFNELEIFYGQTIDINNSLIFFDEIQNCKNAIKSLRYFYEQLPKLNIISAGSLLEFTLSDISFPVGRVEILNMYPLNFYEYLLGIKKPQLAEIIISKPLTLSKTIHNILLENLFTFFFVGGMPEAVKTFAHTKRLSDVTKVQSDLIATYRQDFSHYIPRVNKQCINAVMSSSAKNAGKQIKYSRLAEGFSNPTIKQAFETLNMSRLLYKCRATSAAGIPLEALASEKKFKVFFFDIGLLSHLNSLTNNFLEMKKDIQKTFTGGLAEQFVAQEIISSKNNIYYWARDAKNSSAEIDFLIEKNGSIIPIEVKNSSKGRLKSLHLFLQEFQKINNAIVFNTAIYRTNNNERITFLPIYYAYKTTKN